MDYAMNSERLNMGELVREMMYQFLIQISHWPVKSFNLPTLGSNISNICPPILEILVSILQQANFLNFLNISNKFNFEMWNGFEGSYTKKSDIRKDSNLSQDCRGWNGFEWKIRNQKICLFVHEIFQLFSYQSISGSKVPIWDCAPKLLWNNISPKTNEKDL